jgi:hypothetical protein
MRNLLKHGTWKELPGCSCVDYIDYDSSSSKARAFPLCMKSWISQYSQPPAAAAPHDIIYTDGREVGWGGVGRYMPQYMNVSLLRPLISLLISFLLRVWFWTPSHASGDHKTKSERECTLLWTERFRPVKSAECFLTHHPAGRFISERPMRRRGWYVYGAKSTP